MSFFGSTVANIGQYDWKPLLAPFTNRTGSTLQKGQVAMIDVLLTQSTYSTSVFTGVGNLTPCVQTTAVDLGCPVVVANDQIIDGATGLCVVAGYCEVSILQTGASTTDITAKNQTLSVLVSESAVAVQGTASGKRVLGIALEIPPTTDDTSDTRRITTNQFRRLCLWMGGLPGFGVQT